MNEKTLNDQLRRVMLTCALIGTVILILGVLILLTIQKSLGDMVSDDMKMETEEYKKRIFRQMNKDFQLLETAAAMMSYGDMTNQEWFNRCLNDANRKNQFVTMAYYNQEGIGTLVYSDYGVQTNVDYRTISERTFDTIENALKGKRGVSELFSSQFVPERIFIYGVPVTDRNGRVIGTLVAGSKVDVFMESIDSNGALAGKHAVHLVNADGEILLSTTLKDPKDRPGDIFHSSYFSGEAQEKIQEALREGTSLFTEMTYEGKLYHVFMNPVGLNGWYVVYANSKEGVNQAAYRMVNIMGIAFVVLTGMVLLLLLNTYRTTAESAKNLVRIAYSDRLTGADNGNRFNENLERERRNGGFCLIALNIHQFKFINEIFGVRAADSFLCSIKESMDACIRKGEFYCRKSGDLFYLFLRETDQAVIRERVERLMDEIRGIRISEKTDYQIMVYAGALILDGHSNGNAVSSEMLITRTRFAMQTSKKRSANGLHFYDTEIHKNEEMKNYVETHMHQALERGEFKLFLQPKISLKEGKLGGAEALVRWITEEGRILFPDSFIPQFESNGFCVLLDMYMVEQACKQIRQWMDQGVTPIPISVNQSKLLFFDAGYLDHLRATLEQYRIPAQLITLEILEGLALEHAGEINDKLRQLRKMGFRVSMDDFGNGYSSFNTLGNLEIDELKLDRAFLMEAASDKGTRFCTIMEHIVNLTKSLDIMTVAEGVETLENEEMIKRVGCDFGQGYLYSRPISAEEFDRTYMGGAVLTDQLAYNKKILPAF